MMSIHDIYLTYRPLAVTSHNALFIRHIGGQILLREMSTNAQSRVRASEVHSGNNYSEYILCNNLHLKYR